MKDVTKIETARAGRWLSGEVEIRMPRLWLVLGAAALVALVLVAFD